VIAATAAITYGVTRKTPANAALPSGSSTQPTYSAADQAATKKRICDTFDMATREQEGQGALVTNGQANITAAVRSLNDVAAIQNVITPSLPANVVTAAQKYIDANLYLATDALGNASIEEGNRLNKIANDATFTLADVCGCPTDGVGC